MPALSPDDNCWLFLEVITAVGEVDGAEVDETDVDAGEYPDMMKDACTSCVRGDSPHSKFLSTPVPSLFAPRPIKSYCWQKGELETLLLLAGEIKQV